jgi:hypothetical protein
MRPGSPFLPPGLWRSTPELRVTRLGRGSQAAGASGPRISGQTTAFRPTALCRRSRPLSARPGRADADRAGTDSIRCPVSHPTRQGASVASNRSAYSPRPRRNLIWLRRRVLLYAWWLESLNRGTRKSLSWRLATAVLVALGLMAWLVTFWGPSILVLAARHLFSAGIVMALQSALLTNRGRGKGTEFYSRLCTPRSTGMEDDGCHAGVLPTSRNPRWCHSCVASNGDVCTRQPRRSNFRCRKSWHRPAHHDTHWMLCWGVSHAE